MAGSKRWPRKGEPSASQPFFSISWTFYKQKTDRLAGPPTGMPRQVLLCILHWRSTGESLQILPCTNTLPVTSRILATLMVQLLSLPTGYVQNPRGLMGCRVGRPPTTLAGGVRAMGSATPASSLSGSPSLQEQQAA